MKKIFLFVLLAVLAILSVSTANGQNCPEKPMVQVSTNDQSLTDAIRSIPAVYYNFMAVDQTPSGYKGDFLLKVTAQDVGYSSCGVSVNGSGFNRDSQELEYFIQWINRDGVVIDSNKNEPIRARNIIGQNFSANFSIGCTQINISGNKQTDKSLSGLPRYLATWIPPQPPIIYPVKLSECEWNNYCPVVGQEWLLYYGNDLQLAQLEVLQVLPCRTIKLKYKKIDYPFPFSLSGTTVHLSVKSQE